MSLSSAIHLRYCNECVIWKILFELWVIDILHHVTYHMLKVRWLSAQLFNTPYRMPEQTLLAYLDFST
jgi:hypothetical protein